jgi:hypothetical protein
MPIDRVISVQVRVLRCCCCPHIYFLFCNQICMMYRVWNLISYYSGPIVSEATFNLDESDGPYNQICLAPIRSQPRAAWPRHGHRHAGRRNLRTSSWKRPSSASRRTKPRVSSVPPWSASGCRLVTDPSFRGQERTVVSHRATTGMQCVYHYCAHVSGG